MSRRDQITMTDDEVRSFLAEERTVVCATNGHDGFPHLMPLWFVVRDDRLWAWTYGASQKVRNLERDPRATIQVEAGVEYHLLRGVMFKCDVVEHTDTPVVADTGLAIFGRYGGDAGTARDASGRSEVAEDVRAMVVKQAAKRVALEFVERSRATWDHRKLAGVY